MKTIYILVIVILLASCSSAPSADTVATSVAATVVAQQPAQQEQVSSPVAPQVTNTTVPTKVPEPTATKAPTATKIPPTLVPTPSYSDPVVLVEFSGTGAIVTEDYQLPQCWKAMLYWHVATNSGGSASLILTAFNKDTGKNVGLINEFAMDVGIDGFGGIVLDPLLGGEYYFTTENTDEAWTARLECHDGVAPVGTGMNIQATGSTVTDNYTLPACNKSIFNWSVEPNNNGAASLILYLCDLKKNCETIVNEFQMDVTAPLTGQALQAVKAGDYFLESQNTQQLWSVTWECKD